MDIEILIYILAGIGIVFMLTSTIYTFMFFGIFYRRKSIMLERDNLENTQYYPFAEQLKKDILTARAIPCEGVRIRAQDGVELFGRYYDRGADKAIIFVHGYQSNAFNNFSAAMIDFLNRGYSVLLIDQRAHGDSGGKFTALGCKEKDDLQLWIDYIDKKAEVENIIIYGISMGATTVGYTAEKIRSSKVKGLIMEAGFPCFYEELENSLGRVFMRQAALNYIYL
jgi:dipeptidyl aminopeptidase/acylaminoacyl peptidase